jgi:flagellar biosynthesis protein FlhB
MGAWNRAARRVGNAVVMRDVRSGIVLIAIGCALIIFRKWFARESVDAQNWTFGFHFGEKSIKMSYWFVPIMGLIFIIFGILVILGVFK